jgi:hypothetical protein
MQRDEFDTEFHHNEDDWENAETDDFPEDPVEVWSQAQLDPDTESGEDDREKKVGSNAGRWWVRGVIGVVILVIAFGVIGQVVYQEAKEEWSEPISLEHYAALNQTRYEESGDSDRRLFIFTVDSVEDQTQAMEEIERFYSSQLEQCERMYEFVDNTEIYSRSVCSETHSHDLLGFVRYVQVTIDRGNSYQSYQCATLDLFRDEISGLMVELANAFEIQSPELGLPYRDFQYIEGRFRDFHRYLNEASATDTSCVFPAVQVEVRRGWEA